MELLEYSFHLVCSLCPLASYRLVVAQETLIRHTDNVFFRGGCSSQLSKWLSVELNSIVPQKTQSVILTGMDPKVSSVLKSHKGCLVYPYSGVREAGIQLLPRPIRSNESDLDQSYRTPGKASESSSTSPAISRQKDASHQSFTSQNSSVTQPHSRPFTPHPSVGNTNVLSPQPPVNSKSYPQFGRKELQEVVAHGEKNIDRTDLITALQAGWNVTNAIQVGVYNYDLNKTLF
ncbi:unnamed protein product [Protopolystoma xenopodis]|uniref:Uncharacterized protein n=1 Tax=Protopolystoma xenopodis TaxID=117903 RepID=A0A3S5AK60_9PLAT|nr:unnamed protein product [Protopolystoma xenopodis]